MIKHDTSKRAWFSSSGVPVTLMRTLDVQGVGIRGSGKQTFRMLSDSPKLAITVATKRARLDARRGCASSTALNCGDKHRHASQLSFVTVMAACGVVAAGNSSCRHWEKLHQELAAQRDKLASGGSHLVP